MQTARMLEPRDRTVGSKLIEIARAWQIERRLSKDEILALYLTLTPYGGNLEGVRAASWSYFGHEADRLSDDEIALLIALPQSPEVRRPDRRPGQARKARDWVATKLGRYGVFSAADVEDVALGRDPEPVPVQQLGTAGDHSGVAARQGGRRRCDVGSPGVSEVFHRNRSFAAASTAAVICG